MLTGVLFLLAGLAIIFHWHTGIAVRSFVALAWFGDTFRELRRQARGHARVHLLQLDSHGRMSSHDRAGKSRVIQVLGGSVVLRHWAWLRLGFDDGLYYVEFLLRRDCTPLVWRRLQLIWRQAF